MPVHSMLKTVGALGALVGLLTGVGTIIGWIASDSFLHAAFDALRWAGVLFIGPAVGAGFYSAYGRESPRRSRRFASGFVAILMSGALLYTGITSAAAGEGSWGLFALGCFAVSTGLLFLRAWVVQQRTEYKTSHKECPDCAETVKVKARVCRYCGYRFAPPQWPNSSLRLPN